MRIFGLLLIILAVAAIFLIRAGMPGNKLVEGRLGFAVVPPLILGAFAMGVAFVISG
jgi:hypothetical protein